MAYQLAVVFSIGTLLFIVVGLLVWRQLDMMQQRIAELNALTDVRSHARDIRLQEVMRQSVTLQFVVDGAVAQSQPAADYAPDAVSADVAFLLAVAKSDPSLFLVHFRPRLGDGSTESAKALDAAKHSRAAFLAAVGRQAPSSRDLDALYTFADPDPGLLVKLAQTQAALGAVESFFAHELSYAKRHSQKEAVLELRRSQKSLASLQSAIKELIAYTVQKTSIANAALENARRNVLETLLANIVFAVLVFTVVAAFMGRRLAVRLHRAESSITGIAEREFPKIEEAFEALLQSDLSFRLNPQAKAIPVTGSDEIAAVEASVNAIVKSLTIVQHRFNEMVERTTREVSERKRAEKLRRLGIEFGQQALATPDLAPVKERAVELVSGAMPAPFVRIGEFDAAATSIAFGAGVWPGSPAGDRAPTVAGSLPLDSSRSGQPVFLESESGVPGIGASATIPIIGKNAIVGLLQVGWPQPHAFSRDEETFLVAVGTIIGSAIERERREARIRDLNVELQHRYAELETFSYSVAHDLRAPLRAVSGFAIALKEDYGPALDDEAQRYIGLIVKGADQMGDLINALLSLARVSRQELSIESTDLSEKALSIVAELRAANPGRNVTATVEDGMTVAGDPALLRDVLANLLSNAWKFTRGRDPALIRFESHRHNGKTVYAVTDNGVGFATDYPDELFAPFKRLHGKSFEGTGIGLATVARIVQRHGGQIWAESEPGAGARFSFTLGDAGERAPAPAAGRS